MKKYFIALTVVALIALAGCQDSVDQSYTIDTPADQTQDSGTGSVSNIPPAETPETEEVTPATTSETQQDTQATSETQTSETGTTTEKDGGLKVEGNVSPDFKVTEIKK